MEGSDRSPVRAKAKPEVAFRAPLITCVEAMTWAMEVSDGPGIQLMAVVSVLRCAEEAAGKAVSIAGH